MRGEPSTSASAQGAFYHHSGRGTTRSTVPAPARGLQTGWPLTDSAGQRVLAAVGNVVGRQTALHALKTVRSSCCRALGLDRRIQQRLDLPPKNCLLTIATTSTSTTLRRARHLGQAASPHHGSRQHALQGQLAARGGHRPAPVSLFAGPLYARQPGMWRGVAWRGVGVLKRPAEM